MKEFAQKLRVLIASNKVEDAFQVFSKALEGAGNKHQEEQDQIILLAARYNDVRKKERLGLIRFDDASIAQTQIKSAFLELVSLFEEQDRQEERNVFISYNHGNREIAGVLKQKLKAHGVNVVIDSDSMLAGDDIKAFIQKSVAETQVTISIVSKESLLSAWVAMETITTFYQEQLKVQKKFIACYVNDEIFQRSFTDEALRFIEKEMQSISVAREERTKKGYDTRDLNNEYSRLKDLSAHLDEIIRRLRESLCIDIRKEKLEENFEKLLQAVGVS